MSTRNSASLSTPIRLVHGDYQTLLGQHRFPARRRVVAFLAPPWDDALSAQTGLDLGRTKSLIVDIIEEFARVCPDSPVLYVVEAHERPVPGPLALLRRAFDWSEFNVYDIAEPTGRYGVPLGTKRWRT